MKLFAAPKLFLILCCTCLIISSRSSATDWTEWDYLFKGKVLHTNTGVIHTGGVVVNPKVDFRTVTIPDQCEFRLGFYGTFLTTETIDNLQKTYGGPTKFLFTKELQLGTRLRDRSRFISGVLFNIADTPYKSYEILFDLYFNKGVQKFVNATVDKVNNNFRYTYFDYVSQNKADFFELQFRCLGGAIAVND